MQTICLCSLNQPQPFTRCLITNSSHEFPYSSPTTGIKHSYCQEIIPTLWIFSVQLLQLQSFVPVAEKGKSRTCNHNGSGRGAETATHFPGCVRKTYRHAYINTSWCTCPEFLFLLEIILRCSHRLFCRTPVSFLVMKGVSIP